MNDDCPHCSGCGMVCLECDQPLPMCDCGDTVEGVCAACLWDDQSADLIDAEKVSTLREALSDLVEAVKKEVDDKPLLGVSGWLGARISDAHKALKDTQ